MLLRDGYSDVPTGKLAAVVTCLEMCERPAVRPDPREAPWRLRRIDLPDVDWYRELFRRVGAEWLWYSRLVMPLPALSEILDSPDNEVYALDAAGTDEGLLELDFRAPGQCELAFFGLTRAIQGRGAGRWLMNRALEKAWSRPISRLWVHTCTLDHPDALGFYLRSGFTAYARRIEVADDPRLSGVAERTAAPHVPIVAAPA
jgi:GNAT superfamily N-acetyltransferase